MPQKTDKSIGNGESLSHNVQMHEHDTVPANMYNYYVYPLTETGFEILQTLLHIL